MGILPNQAARFNCTPTFDGLKAFAHSFRYIFRGTGLTGESYDAYYLEPMWLLGRIDEGFGVWLEVESGARHLVVEFTDALHVATEPANTDFDRFVCPDAQGGLDRRKLCKEVMALELDYYEPKVVIGNGRLPSDLVWEIHTGRPVEGSPGECLTRYKP